MVTFYCKRKWVPPISARNYSVPWGMLFLLSLKAISMSSLGLHATTRSARAGTACGGFNVQSNVSCLHLQHAPIMGGRRWEWGLADEGRTADVVLYLLIVQKTKN